MDQHKEKRLPPTPSSPRPQGVREDLGNPLEEAAYSHPRAAPLPPAQASDPLTSPNFPLTPLPGLRTSYDQQQPLPQPRTRPQSRAPLRPAPWRTPTSPPRPPPGRFFDRALLSAAPQPTTQRASRSGSLPSINFSNTLGEQQSPHLPRPVTPHPNHGLRSPPSQYARSAIPPVPPTPVTILPAAAAVGFQVHQRQPSSFGIPKPEIPERSPRRSAAGIHSTREKRRSTVSRELDVLEEQLVGLRVPLGEARRGEYHGGGRRGEYHENPGEGRRRQSTNSIYSQVSDGQRSVYAETYHGFMFGDHTHGEGEPSQGNQWQHKPNNPELREKEKQERELPQIFFSPTRTPAGLGSHYRRQQPTGEGPSPPASQTPIRTITRKPARLRPVSTQQQQAVRTPSPLSGTLKGPGPHVPDGDQWGISPAASTNDVSPGGVIHRAPMFARELTASPEVMSSVAVEEDERRGLVSRWSTDSSDLSDSSDEEVSPVSGSPAREAGEEGGQEPGEEPAKEPVQKPSEEYHEGHHEGQEVARLTPSALDSTTSTSSSNSSRSNSEPSPASPENEGTEQYQNDEEPILLFNNLTIQVANLQASLNHLVSHATCVETAFGQVRDAMIALRRKTTETLVGTQQFLEEIQGVKRQLRELRRVVEGKGKEVVRDDEEKQRTRKEEGRGQGERNDRHKGHEKEQDRKREARREGQQRPEEPREGPPKPRRGPPSGPAPGGAESV